MRRRFCGLLLLLMIAGDEEEVLWVVAAAASFQRTSCGLRRAYCSSATSDFSADHSSALPGVMTSQCSRCFVCGVAAAGVHRLCLLVVFWFFAPLPGLAFASGAWPSW